MEILSKILMIISEIKKITKGIILEDEPMSQHTSYGIGGKVLAYIRPYDRSDLIRIIKLINKFMRSNTVHELVFYEFPKI